MPDQRSDKSPFESRFGGGWVSAGQFLAEGMVAKQARTKKVDLPQKFWSKDPWKRDFMLQLRYANSLLKLYSANAIIRVLRSPAGKKAFSLGAKWLDPLFAAEHEKLEREAARRQETPVEPVPETKAVTNEKPREGFIGKPSTMQKLRNLE